MDIDLMVSAGVAPYWDWGYDCASWNEGSNELCTITDVTPGTYYITLDVYQSWAADITDTYLTACTGADCSVELPERAPIREIVDFPIPLPVEVIPGADTFGTCDLARPYERSEEVAGFSFTNNTTTPVTLFWVSNETGSHDFSSPSATLNEGESYNNEWSMGERVVVTDLSNKCLGVAVFTEAANNYEIDSAMVSDAVTPPVAEIGSCDLVEPYTRAGGSASINIVNTTSTPVTLYWLNTDSGDSVGPYATLNQGEAYRADFWSVGDRMMLADASDACLGVAEFSDAHNRFEIDSSITGG